MTTAFSLHSTSTAGLTSGTEMTANATRCLQPAVPAQGLRCWQARPHLLVSDSRARAPTGIANGRYTAQQDTWCSTLRASRRNTTRTSYKSMQAVACAKGGEVRCSCCKLPGIVAAKLPPSPFCMLLAQVRGVFCYRLHDSGALTGR